MPREAAHHGRMRCYAGPLSQGLFCSTCLIGPVACGPVDRGGRRTPMPSCRVRVPPPPCAPLLCAHMSHMTVPACRCGGGFGRWNAQSPRSCWPAPCAHPTRSPSAWAPATSPTSARPWRQLTPSTRYGNDRPLLQPTLAPAAAALSCGPRTGAPIASWMRLVSPGVSPRRLAGHMTAPRGCCPWRHAALQRDHAGPGRPAGSHPTVVRAVGGDPQSDGGRPRPRHRQRRHGGGRPHGPQGPGAPPSSSHPARWSPRVASSHDCPNRLELSVAQPRVPSLRHNRAHRADSPPHPACTHAFLLHTPTLCVCHGAVSR